MVLWKFTYREMMNRPGRATLTLLSIVIGVAAVVAVTVGTATTQQACQDMYTSVAGRAALEVVREGNGYFDEDIADLIEQVPGVKHAVPSVMQGALLRADNQKKVALSVLGIDLERDRAVRDYMLAEGRFFEDKYEALLETSFAKGLGIGVGDEITLAAKQGGIHGSIKKFTIVGLLSPQGVAGFQKGGIVFLPLRSAESMFHKSGNIDTISIVLNDDADEKAVASVIAKGLPEGMSIRSPMERAQLSKETIEKVRQGLDFAYVMILALAFFTILNTFLMNVGERRRQLAVLRAIGTTRRQLIKMLLLEGLAMGCVGTLLGMVAGLGGAYLLTASMGQLYGAKMPALQITPGPFIFAGLLGPSVSLFAMFIPARIAGKVSPLEGIRFVATDLQHRISIGYVVFAIVSFFSTGGALAACILGYLPSKLMVVSGMLFTVAFLLLLPMVLNALAWFFATILHPVLGTEGRVAHRQILRRRVRTTLTIGILYLAVSTAVSLGTNILNTVDDVHSWLEKALVGDFYIRTISQSQEATSVQSAKMSESLVKDLVAIDGVTNVDSITWVPTTVHSLRDKDVKINVNVFVRNFSGKSVLPLDLMGADPEQVRKQLTQGEVVLGTVLAHRTGAKVGDEITLETSNGPKQLRVAAMATVYQKDGMVVYLEGSIAREMLNVDGVSAFAVTVTPGMSATVGEKLKKFCDREGLLLQSLADLRALVDQLTKGLIAGLWGLLVLGLVVGAIAIANTLTMNVLEQTRELALLRVVAMTRWQVRKTILAQAIIIGCIGLVTGTLGGMSGAYVMNLSSVPLLGHAPPFALQPSLMGICFGIGLLIILLAAWIPAERAARLKLLIALQYE